MKSILTVIFSLLISNLYAQSETPEILLDSAKTLFKSVYTLSQQELDEFDFNQVRSILERVIELDPNNPEARYFLGYTYSRINSRDGRGMINIRPGLTVKASDQFEYLNRLSQKYEGEIVALDPYSKITSEWGALSFSYWYHNKPDSILWAFNEGKERGGFSDLILELNRKVLDSCSKNSILISSGDNLTFPLMYLQFVENYRKDVSVVDVDLLNTVWYPSLLSEYNNVSFNVSQDSLKEIQYTRWKDSVIVINDFSWIVKPSIQDQYLLRGDRLLLSLLKENKFNRGLFFTTAFNEQRRVNLQEYLTPNVVTDKLAPTGAHILSDLEFHNYKESLSQALPISKYLNLYSIDEINIYNNLRLHALIMISRFIEEGDRTRAKQVFLILEEYMVDSQIPFNNQSALDYFKNLQNSL